MNELLCLKNVGVYLDLTVFHLMSNRHLWQLKKNQNSGGRFDLILSIAMGAKPSF
jgi:hypothetical protein